MGCFSYKCQMCGKGVLSSSFGGEKVKIFLLKDSKVLQSMEGQYDSYGRVFINRTQSKEVKHSLRESVKWQPISEFDEKRKERAKSVGDDHAAWLQVCDLMFDEDISNGLAFIHSKCFTGDIPVVRSVSDPNQGWGDDDDEENLFGNVSIKIPGMKRKIIKDYCVFKDHGLTFLNEEIWQTKRKIEEQRYYINYNNNISKAKPKIKALSNINEQKRLDEAEARLKELEEILNTAG